MPSDEETRAQAFREWQIARSAAENRRRLGDFRSNAGSVVAFRQKWMPWIDPIREWDPPGWDEDEGVQIP